MTDKKEDTAQEVQEATAEPRPVKRPQAVADQEVLQGLGKALGIVLQDDPTPAATDRQALEKEIEAHLNKISSFHLLLLNTLKKAVEIGALTEEEAYSDLLRARRAGTGERIWPDAATVDDIIATYKTDNAGDPLIPFIADELEALRQQPGYEDITIFRLYLQSAEDGPKGDELAELIQRAQEKAEKALSFSGEAGLMMEATARLAHATADAEATATAKLTVKHLEALPRITATMTSVLHYPVDKPNSKIWRGLETATGNGQIRFSFDTGKNAPIYYGINFDALEALDAGLKITKQLTPFDKRVYIAAAALYNAGNEVISATQIHKMMGNKEQPAPNQTKKINDSITKMGAARIFLSNEKEKQVNKKYPLYQYDGALLPFERLSAYINNTLTDSAIHLFREPPLVDFARKRQQVTTISRQLLESPVSKTEKNLQLEDYLLERIAHMKSTKSKAPRKMLLNTIYEKSGITTKKQKDRAPERIKKYLDHYKKTGWIKGFTMDKDSVTIHL